MTPEERTVINAAIRAVHNRSALPDYLRPVKDAVSALIYSCQQCNHDTHRCGGCGAEVGHGEYTCSDCEEPQHDPLSGDLIPAGQDAELEQWGRDMAEAVKAVGPIVRASLGIEPEQIEHLAMDREQRRLELEVLEANALHYESQTEVSAGRAALDIDGVGTGPVLRERVSKLADYHGSITHLQADIDQELCEYRPAPEDCDCPRDQQVYCASLNCHGGDDVLIWHPRTMKDARKGDQIRPAGSDMPNGTAVTDRYWPPQPAVPTRHGPLPADRDTWHVVPGAKHWDDHVVQPGEVWLCLDGGAPRNVDPDFPIEILLTRAEIAAIELLGWDNREETRS